MDDYLFSMTVDVMRRRVLRGVREQWPNFDRMPDTGQLDCVAEYLETGLSRLLRNNAAMKAHREAYEQFLDV